MNKLKFTHVTEVHREWRQELDPETPLPQHLRIALTAVATINIGERKKNSAASVCERTLPTERPLLVSKVSANFCW
jgi:hypothetical protein